jgi:two-component system response regulator MprA
LVVDDDPAIAEILAEVLDEAGYRVRRAYDGRQALEEIARDPPDLIVTDVMMPRIDGLTLTRRLRDRGDQTPIVLMSAVFADVDLPGVRFLPKPFDLDRALHLVDGAVVDHASP